jgi:hypothetical protein
MGQETQEGEEIGSDKDSACSWKDQLVDGQTVEVALRVPKYK